MSDELSPDARRLIDAARSGDVARPGDKSRVRARLVAELGAAAFSTTAISAGDPLLAAGERADGALASSASKLWVKLAKMATVAGTAGALYAGVAHVSRSSPKPVESTPPPTALPSMPSAAPQLEPVPEAMQEEGPVEELEQREAMAPKPESANRARRRAPARVPAATSEAGSLAAELALLERAQRALRDAQPEQALALVREHEQTFPAGALVEERGGIEAIARCMRGEGSEVAKAFLARAPGSPLAARVRKECDKP